MQMTQADIQRLFAVGDVIRSGRKQRYFRITRISDDRVHIQPTQAATPRSLKYKLISIVLKYFHDVDLNKKLDDEVGRILAIESEHDSTNETYLYGFAREFILRSSNDLLDLVQEQEFYSEGQRKLTVHLKRERNSTLIRDAKTSFRNKYGHLYCEACGFNKENNVTYGESIIEGHHIVPLSTLSEATNNTIDAIVLLCPNCHRLTHRSIAVGVISLLTKESIQQLISKSLGS